MGEFKLAIKRGFREYATMYGRSGRAEFWYWMLFAYGTSLALKFFVVFLTLDFLAYAGNTLILPLTFLAGIISTIFSYIVIIPNFSISLRRLHDTGRSGFWLLLIFTLIGIIPLIIWFCEQGELYENKYGKAPAPLWKEIKQN